MRLRSLRKLEEIELRTEHKTLIEEQGHLNALLASDKKQWGEITTQIDDLKKAYGKDTPLGAPQDRVRRRARMPTTPRKPRPPSSSASRSP